jgi:ABC-type polysaccharide/polyol phosphate export permease
VSASGQSALHRRPDRKSEGFGADFVYGLLAWRLWTMLGWNDIRLRYRRSVIGPFWMTLSMAVFIVTLGLLYSEIFHMEVRTYLPYIAVGLITWGFVSTSINECCSCFFENESVIRQVRVPFSAFVLRTIWRNFIVLLHTIVLIIPIWIFFGLKPPLTVLFILPGFLLVYANQMWMGMVAAVLSTRFRDVPLIIQTALQIVIFATPIMWPVSSLGKHSIIAYVNPFYHLIELVRAPLLGEVPSPLSWIVAILMALLGTCLAMALLVRASRRIVYWL